MKRTINILILPTDSCNMRCSYCFHLPHHDSASRMDIGTVRRLYELINGDYDTAKLIWHGGEPLLMGADFFRTALSLQKEYPQVRFTNSVQTNLTLISEEYIDCFQEFGVSVGSSFDGVTNDDSRGMTANVLKGYHMLRERGMGCGFIMVVSGLNIDRLIDSYEFFKRLSANYTMNLYIRQGCEADSVLACDPERAAEKLIELYEYWLWDTACNIRVRYYEDIICFLTTESKGVCTCTSCLGRWLAVRHGGEIVPCNRYFPPEYSYGSVRDYTDLSQAFRSKGFKRLLSKAVKRRKKCSQCPIYDYCEGGCNNTAFCENGIENNNGDSCKVLIPVYEHIKDSIERLKAGTDMKKLNPVVARYINN